jgi:hypothetical protein
MHISNTYAMLILRKYLDHFITNISIYEIPREDKINADYFYFDGIASIKDFV